MHENEARQLLRDAGASPPLLRHAEIVREVAAAIIALLQANGVSLDENLVLCGAILHDTGKIVHPEELIQSGHEHEEAGEKLLLQHDVTPALAHFCVSHRQWQKARCLEEKVVAIADRLWKGKRDFELEREVVQSVAEQSGRELWHVFVQLGSAFENITNNVEQRLLS